MATDRTLVACVTRAMARTLAGCVVGLAAGALALGLAVGSGLWTGVAAGGQGVHTVWGLGQAEPAVVTVSPQDRARRQVARLSERLDCSAAGFGPEVIPASALVQVAGRVRPVTFDEGWAVHTGERPGRLLAVCRS